MNKKVFLMAALAASVSVFSGCSDDDTPAGKNAGDIANESKNVDGGAAYDTKIDSVKVTIGYNGSDGNWVTYELLSVEYANGGFALNLPATVSKGLDSILLARSKEPWMTVGGDAGAKGLRVRGSDIRAYKGDLEVGDFSYTNSAPSANSSRPREAARDTTYSATSADVTFYYADKAISVGGQTTERDTTKMEYVDGSYSGYSGFNYNPNGDYTRYEIMNVDINQSFKPGWNTLYQETKQEYVQKGKTITVTYTIKQTTTVPGGLKWYFRPNSNFAAVETAAKILANKTYTGTDKNNDAQTLTFTSATAYTWTIGSWNDEGTWRINGTRLSLFSSDNFATYFQIENGGDRLVEDYGEVTLTPKK